MPQKTAPVRILLTLDPKHAKLLDERCGGPRMPRSPGPKGSGRAGWVKALIFKELGIQNDNDTIGVLDRIRLEVLTELEKLIVLLYQGGKSTPEVIRYLADERIRPERGKKWYPHQVEAVVNRAAAKSYKWLLGQLEEGSEKNSQNS